MASKVHFTSFRCTGKESLVQKFRRLALTAGIGDIDMKDKYVGIKLHFGEPGNLAYLRPQYARALVEIVKERAASPSWWTATRCTSAAVPMRWITCSRPMKTASAPSRRAAM